MPRSRDAASPLTRSVSKGERSINVSRSFATPEQHARITCARGETHLLRSPLLTQRVSKKSEDHL